MGGYITFALLLRPESTCFNSFHSKVIWSNFALPHFYWSKHVSRVVGVVKIVQSLLMVSASIKQDSEAEELRQAPWQRH